MEKIVIQDSTLYHGDCLDVLPSLDLGAAIVADPPYGNNYKVNAKRTRASSLDWAALRSDAQVDPEWTDVADMPFDPTPWLAFNQAILWGANHYCSRLPDSSKWLIWDKKCHTKPDNFSDCELAFTNLGGTARKFDHLWRGLVRAGAENISKSRKYHPWQKPLALMEWCVDMTEGLVIDPFMGSGTTGVACVNLGRKFIGIEIERKYFDVACERIEIAAAQGRLFA